MLKLICDKLGIIVPEIPHLSRPLNEAPNPFSSRSPVSDLADVRGSESQVPFESCEASSSSTSCVQFDDGAAPSSSASREHSLKMDESQDGF